MEHCTNLYAKKYAELNDYEGIVLNVSGETDGPQTKEAMKRLRSTGGKEFHALYGLSGGGYNVLHILEQLTPDERDRFDLIVVIGAPPTVKKDGHWVDDPKGYPKEADFKKDQFPGGRWTLVYKGLADDSFKPAGTKGGHMFLSLWLLSNYFSKEYEDIEKDREKRCSTVNPPQETKPRKGP